MSSPRVTILFSGGADSVMLWWHALTQGIQPRLLYCLVGAPYEQAELAVCQRLVQLVNAFDLPVMRVTVARHLPPLARLADPSGHVPLRNDLLVRYAALKSDEVWLGAVRGESSRDKSARFLRDTSKSLSYLLQRPVRVRAPLRGKTKADNVRDFLRSCPTQLATALLLTTRSCYNLDQLATAVEGCGRCQACFRRWVAWTRNGLPHIAAYDAREWANEQLQLRGKRMLGQVRREVPLGEWWNVLVNNWQAGWTLACANAHANRSA